jgi:alpha-beta hydrolase superfamily lysophospholipase
MITKEFTFPSSDGKTTVHAVRWMPDSGEFGAILQITHGMVEYIERYTGFAEFLTGHGYLVVGHDHIGHGQSVTSEEEWGYFGRPDPSGLLVADMHTLRTTIQKEYPQKPYFMLGHSMGSYLLRTYLGIHSEGVRGAVIMGTGFVPRNTTNLGKFVCSFLSVFHGWHYRSKFVADASFGKPYKKYDLTGKETSNSWLTKDEAIVTKYYADPKCTFIFTLNGYMGLYEAVSCACDQENVNRYPKELPVFIVSGADDPVGDLGTGVKKVYDMFQTAGMEDVTYQLYDTDRHEILNELDRERVYNDVLAWMNVRLV